MKFTKKLDIFAIFAVFALLIMQNCFIYINCINDELWNFQSIYKMYNGFMIYKDFNVIITPLFFVICNLLFKIFSPTLQVFKLYNLLIYSFLATSLYILFKTLKFNKLKSFLFSFLSFLPTISTIPGGANYNILAIAFVIIGIVLFINSREKNIYLFFNGLIIYLIIFTKQNIGAYYVISICFSELLLNKNLITTIKRLSVQALPAIVLSVITLFIMYKYNILYDFINYAVLGINEFSFSNFYIDIGSLLLIITITFIYLFIIWIIIKKFINDLNIINNLKILICVSLPLNLIIYPILNLYHVLLAFLFLLVLLFYILDFLVFKPLLGDKLYKKICYIAIILLVILQLFNSLLNSINLKDATIYCNDKNHPYYKCYFPNKNISKINNITDYITEKNSQNIDVIVLCQDAALYMIPLRTKS